MSDVFGDLYASRQPIGKPKNRIAVPFIDLKESRRFASPCLFKQKFVCDSVWQTALDSVGIVPTSITVKRLKDTVVEQSVAVPEVSNTNTSEICPMYGAINADSTTMAGVTLVKPWRWMHLEAKRLTEKNRTSKMFLLPISDSIFKAKSRK